MSNHMDVVCFEKAANTAFISTPRTINDRDPAPPRDQWFLSQEDLPRFRDSRTVIAEQAPEPEWRYAHQLMVANLIALSDGIPRMNWNQFLGGVLVGAAFGIMVGAAYGPGSPEKVTTSTAGFCTMLVIAGGVAAGIGRRRSKADQPRPEQ